MRQMLARSATVAALWLAAVAAPGLAAETTMTIAHLYPESLENNEVAPALHHFARLVAERTGGTVAVEVFGSGALGTRVHRFVARVSNTGEAFDHRFGELVERLFRIDIAPGMCHRCRNDESYEQA